MRLTPVILLLLLACLAHGRQLASSNKNAVMAQLGSRGVQVGAWLQIAGRQPLADVCPTLLSLASCLFLLQKTGTPGPGKGNEKVRSRGVALAA